MALPNRITPSRLQVPPSGNGASASVWGGPPPTLIFFSFPPAKKPTDRLSGDQKGCAEPSVPASGRKRRALLLADVVEGADVRMCELRDRASLTIEAFAELRIGRECLRKDFDRDRAIKPRVAGFVYLAHAAGPKRGEDLVRAEAGAGAEGQTAVDYTGGAAVPTGLLQTA